MDRGLRLLGLVAGVALVVGAGCGDSTGTGGTGGAGGNGGGHIGGTDTGGTGTGGADTGGSDAGGSDAGGGPGGAACASYCATIMSSCAASNSQYASETACNAECAAFDQGDAGAMMGNSLECRAYHAGVAATTDPELHCIHAGPLGGGAEPTTGDGCGTDRCESFCLVAEEICTGIADYPFTSLDDCKTQCLGFTDDTDFTINETTGDTLACRMYHLSVAASGGSEQTTHCPHVAGALCTD